MTDSVAELQSHPGTLSPRDINTRRYRVVEALPIAALPAPGESLEVWPWGEVFAHVKDCGPVCKNADIKGWVEQGMIVEERA